MRLARNYIKNGISTQKELQEKLKDIGVELHAPTLSTYLERIQAIDGGSRKSAFELFKANRRAMDLVQKYSGPNKEIKTQLELLEELGKIKVNIDKKTLIKYRKKLKEEAQQNPGFGATAHLPNQSQSTEMLDFSNPAPFIQAPQIAQQSSNFTSGNPGSSRSASEKGKSTNFSKKNSGNWSLSSIKGFVSDLVGASPQEPQFSPSMHGTAEASSYYPSNQPDDQTLESMITPRNQKGSAPHYGDAMPSQQVPPMDDIFVPSHAGTDSTDWFGENLQSFVSSWFGASQQEPQFSPSMHDTSAASSYYPSNQPDDQTLQSMITPINQKGKALGIS
uniref:ENTH domain-containing protein n=1 Tax=Globodera pallida TaxID=36090 RepID=A0A183C2U2_GLOPA